MPYSERVIDVRSRPAFLHDFYGKRRETPEFETAVWLNKRVGSKEPEHFARSQTLDGYLKEIALANVAASVVIGRDTPAIQNDNDEIAALVKGRRQLIGVGSVDPQRLKGDASVAECYRAVNDLGLVAINLEPGFLAEPLHFDDRALSPIYEALQHLSVPVFLMTGPTTPDLAFNNPDAIGRVARAFPKLTIVVHHGCWPRVNEIVGVAFRYSNVYLVPDMYIFAPGGNLYVEAANGFMQDQILFGSSFPFRAIKQSIDDYAAIGFSPEVLHAVMSKNAERVLALKG